MMLLRQSSLRGLFNCSSFLFYQKKANYFLSNSLSNVYYHLFALELYFSKTHEYIDVKGSVGTVGITKHAESKIGDVVHVNFPFVGSVVGSGGKLICI